MENKQEMYDFVSDITDYIKKLNDIHLTLSFSPSESLVEHIFSFFKALGFSGFILDVELNPQIHGGIIVSVGGNYHDLSLTSYVENWVNKNAL